MRTFKRNQPDNKSYFTEMTGNCLQASTFIWLIQLTFDLFY